MKTIFQVPPVILSNIENKQFPLIPIIPAPPARPNFQMQDEKLNNVEKRYPVDEFLQSFADIRELNKNDAEIKRLQQENSFLNKILNTLFPEKISEEEPEYVKYVTKPEIATTTSTTTIEYTDYAKEPTILNLQKHELSKSVDIELPYTKQGFQKQQEPAVQEENRIETKQENFNLFSQFSSLSDIKAMIQRDPTYFTRMQGLKNLKKDS